MDIQIYEIDIINKYFDKIHDIDHADVVKLDFSDKFRGWYD